eukprot:scaffold13631_cov38-Cyclotella_meneghiniana.AAC.13
MHGGWTSNFGLVGMKDRLIVGSFSPITETTKQTYEQKLIGDNSHTHASCIAVYSNLWDYSHQNGRKINRLDMSSNYNDQKVYYDSWAEEALTTLELRLTPLTARFPISDRSCGAAS